MKLICISNSLQEIKKVKKWAKMNHAQLKCYSPVEWKQQNKQQAHSFKKRKKNQSTAEIIPFPVIKNRAFCTSMVEIKVHTIQQALIKTGGNAVSAANMLKISRATLYRIVKEYNIDMTSIRHYDQDTYSPLRFKKSA